MTASAEQQAWVEQRFKARTGRGFHEVYDNPDQASALAAPTGSATYTAGQLQAASALQKFQTSPGQYDVEGYLLYSQEKLGLSPSAALGALEDAGFSHSAIKESAAGAAEYTGKVHEAASQSWNSQVWQGLTPWDESRGETASFGGAAILAAEIVVPGVYSARHWKDMSNAERAFSIGIDALCLIPVAGAVARGAKGVNTVGRMARVVGAAKGLGREAVVQVLAPVDMIIHPVKTAKSVVTTTADIIENIAHPAKLPEAIITTSDRVVSFRVNDATTAEEAFRIRDELTSLVAAGKKPVVVFDGPGGKQVVELAVSPLMKETRGGLSHVTPDIDVLLNSTVHTKPGLVAKEQGWFLATEPATRFKGKSAFGLGDIPIPNKAGSRVEEIGRYRPSELVLLDKEPIRSLNLADAANIPPEIAAPMQNYIKNQKGIIYGSMNEWVKVKKAAVPNDVDVVFHNATKAMEDIEGIARSAGYQTRRVPHGIQIMKDGEWVKICDIASVSGHEKMLKFPVVTNGVEGIQMETLGRQYVAQAFGAVQKNAKAAERAQRLEKASKDISRMIKDAKLVRKRPGIFIISSETAGKTINTEKLFFQDGELVAEMERKLAVGEKIPKVKQRLFTRIGANKEVVEVWLENPLTKKQRLKLKGIALVEDLKAPFKPAIAIEGKTAARTEYDTNQIIDILKSSGNRDQARAMASVAASVRVSPRSLEAVVGNVRVKPVKGGRASGKSSRRVDSITAESTRVDTAAMETARQDVIDHLRETERTKSTDSEGRAQDRQGEDRRADRRGEDRGGSARDTTRNPRGEDRGGRGGDRGGGRKDRDRGRRDTPDNPNYKVREPTRETVRKPPHYPKKVTDDNKEARPLLPEPTPGGYNRIEYPQGTKAWRQGMGWWVLKPPYTRPQDREFTFNKPKGAEILPNAKKALETVQAIGGPSPQEVKMDMGVMDVYIKDPPRKPNVRKGRGAIRFVRSNDKQTKGVKPTKQGGGSKKKGIYHHRGGAVSRNRI